MNSSPLVDYISFPTLEQDDRQEKKDERAVVMAAAEAAITTTMTQFQAPPIASITRATALPASFTSIPFYTTTVITTATFTTQPSPHSAPFDLFSFDNASPWHHLVPALVAFAILGALSSLLLLLLLFLCVYRRQRRRQHYSLEENATVDINNRPSLCGHTEKVQTPTSTATTLHHLGIPETSKSSPVVQYPHHHVQQQQQQQAYHPIPTSMFPVSGSAPTTPHHPRPQLYHYFTATTPQPSMSSPMSSTFVPIETSPLTLVPRAAIWKDPQRRRGVNELDLWEQKQQQQQKHQPHPPTTSTPHDDPASTSPTSSTHDKIQPIFTPFPFLQHGTPNDDDDDDNHDGSLDNGKDRPWQRYVQSSSRPIDLSALDDGSGADQHSLHSSSTILHPHPVYNLNQEISDSRTTMDSEKIEQDTVSRNIHGCLESSGSSQWLCPPSTFKS